MTDCYKCHTPVPQHNDATLFDCELTDEPSIALISISCHLLPVIGDGGEVVCEGSPSRAQYLEGQPRDTRPGYPFRPERVGEMRAAFVRFRERYPVPA